MSGYVKSLPQHHAQPYSRLKTLAANGRHQAAWLAPGKSRFLDHSFAVSASPNARPSVRATLHQWQRQSCFISAFNHNLAGFLIGYIPYPIGPKGTASVGRIQNVATKIGGRPLILFPAFVIFAECHEDPARFM
jgi:hypothetical protein